MNDQQQQSFCRNLADSLLQRAACRRSCSSSQSGIPLRFCVLDKCIQASSQILSGLAVSSIFLVPTLSRLEILYVRSGLSWSRSILRKTDIVRFGPTGLHTTARELQTCTFEGSGASNTTKIPREDTQRDTKRAKMGSGKGRKSAKFWAPPPFGPPTLRGHTLRVFVLPCFVFSSCCSYFLKKKAKRLKHQSSRFGQSRSNQDGQSRSNVFGQSRFGQSRNWPKLAKVGWSKSANKDGQSRNGQSRHQPIWLPAPGYVPKKVRVVCLL